MSRTWLRQHRHKLLAGVQFPHSIEHAAAAFIWIWRLAYPCESGADLVDRRICTWHELSLRFIPSSFDFVGCSLHHGFDSFKATAQMGLFFRVEWYAFKQVCNETFNGNVGWIGHAKPYSVSRWFNQSLFEDLAEATRTPCRRLKNVIRLARIRAGNAIENIVERNLGAFRIAVFTRFNQPFSFV
jgi:hypothetical protein